MDGEDQGPVLTAVSNSARQLSTLLRCIHFSDKANVQITEQGLKFSVDEASAMEGSAFLDKSLFSTYTYNAPPPQQRSQRDDSDDEDEAEDASAPPTFQISLPSLLETLQILGLTTDPNYTKPQWGGTISSTAFNNNVLGVNNMCRITYEGEGFPLSIILTESTIRTTCNLTTYEPAFSDDIPFDRQSLAFKTIMRGSWLFDAVTELASTNPETLTLVAKMLKGKPYFALSASGPLGSARVEFNNNKSNASSSRRRPAATNPSDPTPDPAAQPNLLETFQLSDPDTPLRYPYKFALIQKAAKAMSLATKVSVRADTQGVLSLQFMIEIESGKASFVDFRFVPLVDDEEGDETFVENGNGGENESGTDSDDEMLVT